MSLFRRGEIWWYEFWFAGRRIQESSKSASKTVAKSAEQKRRRELEAGLQQHHRHPAGAYPHLRRSGRRISRRLQVAPSRSAVFAEYAVGHLMRLLGSKMLVDFNGAVVIRVSE